MLQTKAKVIKNIVVAPECYKMVLACAPIAKSARPGEFVTVKISGNDQPLLRRPFGVHSAKGAEFELLYEVVGPGTRILSKKKAGEYLDIIGPLGKGFDYKSPGANHQALVLVAGGMGVAPLLFLAEKLVTSHQSPVTSQKPIILIGAKTKQKILCEKEFKKLGCEVKVATDDGSGGFKGKVTELLKEFLLKNLRTKELKNIIYGCGPRPMLKEISRISAEYTIPAQISLEEHMACGIGACLGCVVKTREGLKRVCKEGPVFQAQDIIWEAR